MTNVWDKFWLQEVPPHGLALTRIALGLYLLVYAGLYVPHLTTLFSNEGLALPLYLDQFPAYASVLAPPSPLVAHIIYAIFLLAMLGITLGAFFRLSTLVTIVLALHHWQLQLHIFPTSYNRILLFTLLVLLFSGAHRTLSFDQWRRSGSVFDWEPISILAGRLITLQITATFMVVSLQKWWLPHWKGGEILAHSFISRWSTPLGRWYAQLPFTYHHYDFLVLVVKFCQPIAALGMWVKGAQFVSWIFLSGFIIMVSVMLSIWWFIFIIPASILFWDQQIVYEWSKAKSKGKIPARAAKNNKIQR